MAKASREKGLKGEREVRALWESRGATVRNFQNNRGGESDLIVQCEGIDLLYQEVKRCETARPWQWLAQAEANAPMYAVPVVSFRRNKSRWYALIGLDDLARLLA